jgi:hypothetical protein
VLVLFPIKKQSGPARPTARRFAGVRVDRREGFVGAKAATNKGRRRRRRRQSRPPRSLTERRGCFFSRPFSRRLALKGAHQAAACRRRVEVLDGVVSVQRLDPATP